MTIAQARNQAAERSPNALARLQTMARQRPVLGGGLRAALARHARACEADREAWAQAVLDLANVNAGPAALLAAFRVAAAAPASSQAAGLRQAVVAVRAAADLCRLAGASATRTCLEARFDLAPRLQTPNAGPEIAWWRALHHLARDAPGSIKSAVRASDRIIAACGTEGYEAFVAAGLRAASDPARREAFFALHDPEARRILDRLSGQITFSTLQPRLRAFSTALWGVNVPLREMPAPATDTTKPRRATIASGLVLVPDALEPIAKERRAALYRAMVAHATAHLVFGGERFEPAKLKPVQVALVGLIEDARVEALAMRRFPGLFQVWAPFHEATPSPLKTAPLIFARLARALFDPSYADDDGIVAKGRALFAAEADLADLGLSRRIGDVLGNDIGQMRIQFNAKLHVVEPAYRDDNLGLWALPPPPSDANLQQLDLAVESVRIERREDEVEGSRSSEQEREGVGRARPVAPDDRGIIVARYPEWDRAAALERPDWTTIYEVEPRHGTTREIEEAVLADPGLRMRIERLVRAARVGRTTRLRRQPDGHDLDLAAAIDAATALRIGETPDERIFERKVLRTRDLAVLVLIDVSASTADHVPAVGTSILAVEKVAVAVLAQAMAVLGDAFALRAFSSDGRDEVRYTRIKDFAATFDTSATARLAGLQSRLSTRLGAALRHAGSELGAVPASRRIIITLTDGAPSDLDVDNPTDLVEDARRAVLGLHNRGIDVFGITLDPNGQGAGTAVFGRANHMPVRRVEELPQRLSTLYFRLARR